MARKATHETEIRNRIMRVLAVNQSTLSEMLKRENYAPRDSAGNLDGDEVIRLYIERLRARRAATADQAERLTRAKADREELDYMRECGLLVPVQQVSASFAELYRTLARAIAADRTGLVEPAIRQGLADWRAAVERIVTVEDSDDSDKD